MFTMNQGTKRKKKPAASAASINITFRMICQILRFDTNRPSQEPEDSKQAVGSKQKSVGSGLDLAACASVNPPAPATCLLTSDS
jgi:hypothetical protein